MTSSHSSHSTGLNNPSDSSLTAQSGELEPQIIPPSHPDESTIPQDSNERNILPNAGIRGPITDNFDFEAGINLPDGITWFELPLAVRIRENVDIEEFNNNSILKTIGVKNTPAPRPIDMDIGLPLKPLYYHADDEVCDLIDSEALCTLFAPLPATLLREVVSGRALLKKGTGIELQASRDKTREANGSICSRLLGSMEMSHPVEQSLGEARE
ncbi:hypothetical protein C0993_012729, partial [Termitomyces sp. T159_Od127]